MRAGKLRHLVAFQEPAESPGPTGSPVTTWSNIAWCWAQITPVGGSEAKNLESLQPDVSHTILVRYGGAIKPERVTPKLRILCDPRVFEISSVLNTDERNTQLVIAATERVGNV
jgi:SPP1 family predicted phage head-tail adaptor